LEDESNRAPFDPKSAIQNPELKRIDARRFFA